MGLVPDFQLPKDGLTYSREIFQRCTALIACDIWKDLDPSRFRQWLNNFTTQEEKYFAACVLDGLIYRSKDQTASLIKQLFGRVLVDLTRLDPCPLGCVNDWEQRLRRPPQEGDPGVRLVTAVRRTDPPTKSAHYVARLMKREHSVQERWIIKAWEIPAAVAKGVRVYVFVDDFLATGDQFSKFFSEEALNLLSGVYLVYAPLAAHTSGIELLNREFPALRVAAVETLDRSCGLFSPESKYFDDGVNSPEGAKLFYERLLKRKGIQVDPARRGGHGDLELAYVFEHAAPDNCLPILWWPHTSAWTPLFSR
jgi:hypothetical protein